MSPSSTNPFDDDDDNANNSNANNNESSSAGNNPFDDDEDASSFTSNPTAAAEASWQYLGNLPYRRIPIYSQVQWHADSPTTGLERFPKTTSTSTMDAAETLRWMQSTAQTHVKACPHGGPLAALTTVPTMSSPSATAATTTLRILTNAGVLLREIPVPPPLLQERYTASQIVAMNFTSRTTLVIVMADSLCLTYDLRGNAVLEPFYISPRGDNAGMELVQAVIYEGGVAVLTKDQTVVVCELLSVQDDHDVSLPSPTSRKIMSPNPQANDTFALVTDLPTTADHATRNFCTYVTLAVLPKRHTASQQHPEVFLSTSDHSVVIAVVANQQVTDVDCRARMASPIVDMCFSPNGRFLACFTQASLLTVLSTSLDAKILDFDTSEGSTLPPLEMEWCGEDSVVLHWKNLGVLMVGPLGDWLRFPYKGRVHLLPEMDSCRVITDDAVELLQRVPAETAQLLRIGSIDTAAMLLDASDAFHSSSQVSGDEAVRAMAGAELEQAIVTCMEAATREFDIVTQKRLLRAASYGMHFSYKTSPEEGEEALMGGGSRPSPTAIQFVETSRKLRILNALRNPQVGFVATLAQLDVMTPTGVVARLIAMKRPALACSIASYMSLPQSVQLYARASKAAALVEASASSQQSDSQIAEAAQKVLGGDGALHRGAFATVALAANQAGRPGVANLLLLLETSVADKVPALLATHSFADAMAVATAARDGDFIFRTLQEFEQYAVHGAEADVSKAQASFLGTVVTKFTPEGFHTLRRYWQTTSDVKSVTNLLLRAQRFASAGAAMSQRALTETDLREKQGLLAEASRIFGLGKETAFHKSSTDDYLELLRDQELLRTKHGAYEVAPESSSVTATIAAVIKYAAVNVREQHRLRTDAERIAKKYRVPEKRFWYIQVKALADSEQWSQLRILSESRGKSPIGFKPFARAAIRGKQSANEILKYIERVTLSEERYDLFCEASLWKRALEEAVKLKDPRRVLNVKTLCNSSEIQLMADEMLGRLA